LKSRFEPTTPSISLVNFNVLLQHSKNILSDHLWALDDLLLWQMLGHQSRHFFGWNVGMVFFLYSNDFKSNETFCPKHE